LIGKRAKRIWQAVPAFGLIQELDRVEFGAGLGEPVDQRAQEGGIADEIAPPRREIIIGVLAAEKAHDRETAAREYAERQEKKRLARGIESGDEER